MKNIYLLLSLLCIGYHAKAQTNISGRLYFDNNGNSVYDAGDAPLQFHLLKATPGKSALTDINGMYSVVTDSGIATYTIKAQPYLNAIRIPDSINVTVTAQDTFIVGKDFIYTIQNSYSDVQVSLTQIMPATAGDSIAFDVHLENAGTNIENGVLAVSLPTMFTYNGSTPTANIIGTDSIKWSYSNLLPGSTRQYKLWVKVNGNTDDTYLVYTHVTTANVDSVPANNSATISNTIVATYPGNSKTVYPLNYNSGNLLAGEYLDYTIRFQNPLDTIAEDVVLIDSLRSLFDISTLQVVGSSHNYSLAISGNVLKITYTGINLPTLAQSNTLSHGFFRFKIKPFSNTTFTGTIKNKAYMYYIPIGCDTCNIEDGNAASTECDVVACLKPFTLSLSEVDIKIYPCTTKIAGSSNALVSLLGNGPYTYIWSTGSTASSIANIQNVGTYYVTVTGSCNAKAIGMAIIDTVPGPPIVTQVKTPACQGVTNGKIKLSTCGHGPFTYLWSNGSTDSIISNLLPSQSLSYTVTDSYGQTKTGTASAGQAPSIDYEPELSHCPPLSISLQNVTGAGPFTYQWSNGATTPSITNLSHSTYYFTITDSYGCKKTGDYYIYNIFDYPPTWITTTPIPCTDSFELSFYSNTPGLHICDPNAPSSNADIQPIEFDQMGFYTYILKNSFQNDYELYYGDWDWINPLISGPSGGCYMVPDGYCGGGVIIPTPINPHPPVTATATPLAPTCNGFNNGSINLAVNAGTPPYTYSWSNGDNQAYNDSLAAGTYTYTITDNKQCKKTATVTLTQPAVLNATVANASDSICYGANTGSIQVVGTGGTTPYAYSWSHGATSPTASNLPAADYTCIIRDNKGCRDTITASINQYGSAMQIAEDSRNITCYGDSNGYAKLVVSDGAPGYTYNWTNGYTQAFNDSLAAGNYGYTVTDANNCRSVGSVSITQPSLLSASVNATSPLCYRDSTGTLGINVNGGTPGYSYSWFNGSTDSIITNLGAGQYSYTVSDSNNCKLNGSYILNEPEALRDSVAELLQPGCHGGNNGELKIEVRNGTGPYVYSWNNGNATNTLNGLTAGTYNCIITDANQCILSTSYEVQEPSALLISTVASDTICFGASNGEININVTGGTPDYDYSWLNNGHGENLSAGTYNYTVTDANGCEVTGASTVYERSAISFTTTTTNETICGAADGTAQLNDTIGLQSVICSTGDTTQAISNLQEGSYSVTATDLNGCTASQTISISCITSINNAVLEGILIYPNPAEDVVNIRFADKAIYNVTLRDAQGKLIYHSTASINTQIDLSTYAKGIYVLEIATDNKTIQEKLVVK